jgi:hypothetical protein
MNQPIAPIKGVSSFCINKQLMSPLDFTVSTTRKSISTFTLDTNLELIRQFPIDESCIVMSQHGKNICVADLNMYSLISTTKQTITPMFPFDSSIMSPIVYAISTMEFLLVTASAQGFGIGVFISASGDPIRGTLQWPVVPISVAYQSPYIISLLKNATIQIHNIETQTLVQTITLATSVVPKFMTSVSFPMEIKKNSGSKANSVGTIQVLVGTSTNIFGLYMVPWDVQLQQLFESNK